MAHVECGWRVAPGCVCTLHLKSLKKSTVLSTRLPLPARPMFRPKVLGHTTRAITQSWTGVRQYGQIFMSAAQRSHAS